MRLSGTVKLEGDKSISHRAVMIASLINDVSQIKNLSRSDDVKSTIDCLAQCNVQINHQDDLTIIKGGQLKSPVSILNVGNSGTAARMLLGIFCGQGIKAKLTGDASLLSRPMKRIIEPLTLMGAEILSSNYKFPVEINSGICRPIFYKKKIKSAQVKSSLIFAGLGNEEYSNISFDGASRDHTENFLRFIGHDIKINKNIIIRKSRLEKGFNMAVPGDISNASFIIAAAILIPGSEVKIANLLYNKTRMGFVNVLMKMGAEITIDNIKPSFCEKVCDITASYSPALKGIKINKDNLLPMIDEVPIFSVVAALAKGRTVIRDAGELRVKESDRLSAIYDNLLAMGADISQQDKGLVINGGKQLHSTNINSFNDHRIAMSFAILHLYLNNALSTIDNELSKISFPDFYSSLKVLVNG